jgi:hypothetical protein
LIKNKFRSREINPPDAYPLLKTQGVKTYERSAEKVQGRGGSNKTANNSHHAANKIENL